MEIKVDESDNSMTTRAKVYHDVSNFEISKPELVDKFGSYEKTFGFGTQILNKDEYSIFDQS